MRSSEVARPFSESLNAHKQNTSATKSAIMSALILRDKSVLERQETRYKENGMAGETPLHLLRNSFCVLVHTLNFIHNPFYFHNLTFTVLLTKTKN